MVLCFVACIKDLKIRCEFKDNIFFVAGDITQKGYEKKRSRLLEPYVNAARHGMLLS